MQTLLDVSNSTDLTSSRGLQILQAVFALSLSPNEIDSFSFDILEDLFLDVVSYFFNHSSSSASSSAATESMVGILANVLSSGNCNRFASVANLLTSVFSVGQRNHVPSEETYFDTGAFLSVLQRVSSDLDSVNILSPLKSTVVVDLSSLSDNFDTADFTGIFFCFFVTIFFLLCDIF